MEQQIELRTATAVEAIDIAGGEVVLGGGERLGYDALLIATGARPRRLTLPGTDLEGVCELRTLADCDALHERLQHGARVALIGAGWIGAEVAASARQKGLGVTVVEPLSVPLERVLGPAVGAIYRDLHAEHGVRMLLGRSVVAFEGDGHVSAVRTEDGGRVECDLVIVGVGVTPRAELAQRAGAGEIAARRDLLTRLPFWTGYAVEIALLLDIHATSASPRWRRSTSTCAKTATRHSISSDAWRRPSSRPSCSRLRRDGLLLDEAGADHTICRPPLADALNPRRLDTSSAGIDTEWTGPVERVVAGR